LASQELEKLRSRLETVRSDTDTLKRALIDPVNIRDIAGVQNAEKDAVDAMKEAEFLFNKAEIALAAGQDGDQEEKSAQHPVDLKLDLLRKTIASASSAVDAFEEKAYEENAKLIKADWNAIKEQAINDLSQSKTALADRKALGKKLEKELHEKKEALKQLEGDMKDRIYVKNNVAALDDLLKTLFDLKVVTFKVTVHQKQFDETKQEAVKLEETVLSRTQQMDSFDAVKRNAEGVEELKNINEDIAKLKEELLLAQEEDKAEARKHKEFMKKHKELLNTYAEYRE
jgi:hypothetical protein